MIARLLVSLLCAAALGACAPDNSGAMETSIRIGDMQIEIPADYLDMTKEEYARKIRGFHRAKPPPGATIFVGDSITEFGEWERRFPETRILNYGISGDQSTGLLNRISQIEDAKPARVVVMIGTNDIGMLRRPVSEIAANIRNIVRRLKTVTPQDQILLQSILPREATLYQHVRDLNTLLEEVAAEEGIAFIDLHSSFLGDGPHIDPALSDDMVHLNETGYERWARLIEPWMSDE